jgi:hypothetical protein
MVVRRFGFHWFGIDHGYRPFAAQGQTCEHRPSLDHRRGLAERDPTLGIVRSDFRTGQRVAFFKALRNRECGFAVEQLVEAAGRGLSCRIDVGPAPEL